MRNEGEGKPAGARHSRRRFLRALVFGTGAAIAAACGNGARSVLTTLDATIARDAQGTLVNGPGEPHAVRTDLSPARAGRETTRRSLAVFHHFSDFRIVDEESPLRSEWVESCQPPLATGAFRPQETLALHAVSALIAQANRIDRSPVTGRPVDLAIHSGNAVDNAHRNELRWFLDLMDGRQVNPDSGERGYEGVQPESPAGAYPRLLNDAQQQFQPEALRFPWYAVAGNRDLLAQGNFIPGEEANQLATGSEKVFAIGSAAREEVCADPSGLLGPEASQNVLNDPETIVTRVTPDPARRTLTRQEWIEEHFETAPVPGPVGHGFADENRRSGTAYYTFEVGPIAFIVLDSVNPGGFSAGSIDATQFKWLEEQLKARSSRYLDPEGKVAGEGTPDRLIVIVSHHTAAAMNNPFPDPASQEERYRGPQFEELLHRFPNVVLHVAGHNLEHRITPKPSPFREEGGYWEITTGSPLDYPMQGRLIEITDNGDGTLSFFSTVYDTAAPVKPGDADDPTPQDGVNQTLLASVARAIGVRDEQLDASAAGLSPSDRNAELLLAAPFDLDPTP